MGGMEGDKKWCLHLLNTGSRKQLGKYYFGMHNYFGFHQADLALQWPIARSVHASHFKQ